MASHITYDGVPSTVAGGNIFAGIKFWVSRFVPSRDWIIDMIQTNAGTVVMLEKDANMLIADHARKDAPLGSYSWKYIAESVKAGFVQIEDKYLIGLPASQSRPIRVGSRAKKTRTPFTEADDAILARHVLQSKINTAGNSIYQDLEAQYPHHTYQSWRTRWVKTLSLRSNEEIDRLARMANFDVDNAQFTARHIIKRHERVDWPQPQRLASAVTGGDNEDAQRQTEALPTTAPRQRARRPETNRKSTPDEAAPEQNDDGTDKDSTPYHDGPSGEEQEQERVEGGQGGKGAVNAEEDVNMEEDEDEEQGDDASVGQNPSSFTERDQFYSDLQDYYEASGMEPQKHCVIRGKRIDLWDLFQAVKTQSQPLEEVDWRRAAQYVGFDWAQSKEVIATLIMMSYHSHLAGFVEAMLSFEDDDLDEGSEEDEEVIVQTGETAAEPTTPSRNASGKAKAAKRLLDRQSLTPEQRSKRRRTIGATIPATPEDRQKAKRRLSAPAGQLDRIIYDGSSPHRTPARDGQRQWSSEEPNNTPSQQLRRESHSVMSPELGDEGIRGSGYRELETIMEEEPSAPTPTKPSSKKRSLPVSFQQHKTTHPHERRRQQQQEESTQQGQAPEEQPQTEDESWKTREFHRWTRHYREEGYSDQEISEAMYRTSWIPGTLLERVLKCLREGADIPNDVQGIWTRRDDQKLEYIGQFDSLDPAAGDSSEVQRRKDKAARMLDQLLYKHTKPRVELRWEIYQEIAKQGGKMGG
ncbi:TRF2-interacting telomeric protein/Rap1 C terminal domain-containing protein [Trichoderma austrokoningii]